MMLTFKRLFIIAVSLLSMMAMAGCSGPLDAHAAGVDTTTTSTTAASTTTSSTINSTSSTVNTMVQVAPMTINGQATNILTTGTGTTLYYNTNDTATNVTCTGACTQTWPPFLAQGNIITSRSLSTADVVTVQKTANGNQVEFNGHPLYMYAQDSKAYQMSGQGIDGTWQVATVVAQKFHW